MLFFKSKPKSDELLPPPPPFPSMELEEKEISKKPAEAMVKSSSRDEFEDLFKEVESLGKKEIARPAKELKIKLPKEQPAKKLQAMLPKLKKEKIKPAVKVQKPQKKEILQAKKPAKIIKAERKVIPAKKQALKQAAIKVSNPQSFRFKDLGIDEIQIPKTGEIKLEHEIEFPDEMPESLKLDVGNSQDFHGEDLSFEFQLKPREIQDAEKEIKSAIEKIRRGEKPSFFRKLFARKENGRKMPQIYEKDDMSAVNSRIKMARESLMKFDLDGARENYVEAMKVYKRMAPEEQAKVYNEIRDLYYERKSAEQLKVKA